MSESFLLHYTLNSGIKSTLKLRGDQIEKWIECFKINKVFITEVDVNVFGLNPALVADFKIQNNFSEQRIVINPTSQFVSYNSNNNSESAETYLLKVDCKCKTSYVSESPQKRSRWYCSKCKEMVVLDEAKGLVETSKGKAYYLTNKYIVQESANEV